MLEKAKEIELAKKLRDLTGHGIFECKKVLIENQMNFEKSLEILKKTSRVKTLVNIKNMENNQEIIGNNEL